MASRDLTCDEIMPPLEDGESLVQIHMLRPSSVVTPAVRMQRYQQQHHHQQQNVSESGHSNNKLTIAPSSFSESGRVVSPKNSSTTSIVRNASSPTFNHTATVRDVLTRQIKNSKLKNAGNNHLAGLSRLTISAPTATVDVPTEGGHKATSLVITNNNNNIHQDHLGGGRHSSTSAGTSNGRLNDKRHTSLKTSTPSSSFSTKNSAAAAALNYSLNKLSSNALSEPITVRLASFPSPSSPPSSNSHVTIKISHHHHQHNQQQQQQCQTTTAQLPSTNAQAISGGYWASQQPDSSVLYRNNNNGINNQSQQIQHQLSSSERISNILERETTAANTSSTFYAHPQNFPGQNGASTNAQSPAQMAYSVILQNQHDPRNRCDSTTPGLTGSPQKWAPSRTSPRPGILVKSSQWNHQSATVRRICNTEQPSSRAEVRSSNSEFDIATIAGDPQQQEVLLNGASCGDEFQRKRLRKQHFCDSTSNAPVVAPPEKYMMMEVSGTQAKLSSSATNESAAPSSSLVLIDSGNYVVEQNSATAVPAAASANNCSVVGSVAAVPSQFAPAFCARTERVPKKRGRPKLSGAIGPSPPQRQQQQNVHFVTPSNFPEKQLHHSNQIPHTSVVYALPNQHQLALNNNNMMAANSASIAAMQQPQPKITTVKGTLLNTATEVPPQTPEIKSKRKYHKKTPELDPQTGEVLKKPRKKGSGRKSKRELELAAQQERESAILAGIGFPMPAILHSNAANQSVITTSTTIKINRQQDLIARPSSSFSADDSNLHQCLVPRPKSGECVDDKIATDEELSIHALCRFRTNSECQQLMRQKRELKSICVDSPPSTSHSDPKQRNFLSKINLLENRRAEGLLLIDLRKLADTDSVQDVEIFIKEKQIPGDEGSKQQQKDDPPPSLDWPLSGNYARSPVYSDVRWRLPKHILYLTLGEEWRKKRKRRRSRKNLKKRLDWDLGLVEEDDFKKDLDCDVVGYAEATTGDGAASWKEKIEYEESERHIKTLLRRLDALYFQWQHDFSRFEDLSSRIRTLTENNNSNREICFSFPSSSSASSFQCSKQWRRPKTTTMTTKGDGEVAHGKRSAVNNKTGRPPLPPTQLKSGSMLFRPSMEFIEDLFKDICEVVPENESPETNGVGCSDNTSPPTDIGTVITSATITKKPHKQRQPDRKSSSEELQGKAENSSNPITNPCLLVQNIEELMSFSEHISASSREELHRIYGKMLIGQDKKINSKRRSAALHQTNTIEERRKSQERADCRRLLSQLSIEQQGDFLRSQLCQMRELCATTTCLMRDRSALVNSCIDCVRELFDSEQHVDPEEWGNGDRVATSSQQQTSQGRLGGKDAPTKRAAHKRALLTMATSSRKSSFETADFD